MSIDLMTKVWKDQSKWLTGSRRLVLLALADQANDQGYCWPSQKTIAEKANLGKRYVIHILDELEKVGYIKCQRRIEKHRKISNMYQVVMNPNTLLGIVNQDSLR